MRLPPLVTVKLTVAERESEKVTFNLPFLETSEPPTLTLERCGDGVGVSRGEITGAAGLGAATGASGTGVVSTGDATAVGVGVGVSTGAAAGIAVGSGVGTASGPAPVSAATAASAFRRPPVTDLPASAAFLSAEDSSAHLSCEVLAEGEAERASAAAPATCGVAIEVPLSCR